MEVSRSEKIPSGVHSLSSSSLLLFLTCWPRGKGANRPASHQPALCFHLNFPSCMENLSIGEWKWFGRRTWLPFCMIPPQPPMKGSWEEHVRKQMPRKFLTTGIFRSNGFGISNILVYFFLLDVRSVFFFGCCLSGRGNRLRAAQTSFF